MKKSDTFFQSALNALPNNLAVVNAQRKIVYVNRAWIDFIKKHCATDELCFEDKDYLDVCGSLPLDCTKHSETFMEGMRQILAEKQLEYSYQYLAGTISKPRNFLVRMTSLKSDSNQYVLIGHIDATSIKQKDSQFQQLIESYNLIVTSAGRAVWDWDLSNHKVYYSPEVIAQWGYDEDDMGNSEEEWTSRIHPDDKARVLSSVEDHFEDKTQIFHEEYRVRKKDGSYMWISDDGMAIRDDTGKVTRMVGSTSDINVKSEVIQEFAELEKRYEMILNSVGEGIYGIGNDGTTSFVNAAASELLGYKSFELIGKDPHKAFHHTRPDGRPYPRQECKIYAALNDRRTHHVDNEVFWHRDGSYFPVDYTSTPVLDDDGNAVGVVVIFRDITEHKNTHNMLLNSRERLRNLAARLTQVREEERVQLARELHDDLGQSLSALTMELSRLDEQDNINHYSHHLTKRTEGMIERIREICHNLRPPNLDELGLQGALETLLSDFQEQYDEIRLSQFIDLTDYESHQTRCLTVYRVVQESLTNIIRHADATRVTIKMLIRNNELCLKVSDNGTGITNDDLDSPYSYGIIGMRERVGNLGGNIWFSRNISRGTSIDVNIPIKHE